MKAMICEKVTTPFPISLDCSRSWFSRELEVNAVCPMRWSRLLLGKGMGGGGGSGGIDKKGNPCYCLQFKQ